MSLENEPVLGPYAAMQYGTITGRGGYLRSPTRVRDSLDSLEEEEVKFASSLLNFAKGGNERHAQSEERRRSASIFADGDTAFGHHAETDD